MSTGSVGGVSECHDVQRMRDTDASGARRAVFLDRDGTIARYMEYCCHPGEFELLPGIAQAIRKLNQLGFLVIVVTNQSAIARGWLTFERLQEIHGKMRRELKRHRALVDAVYVCPHHPEDGCACRKPQAGMLIRAARELDISLKNSYFVGDRLQDALTGRSADCTTILVRSGHARESDIKVVPDHEAADLGEAVEWIIHTAEARALQSDARVSTRHVKRTVAAK